MKNYYKVGGSLAPTHQTYVTRSADIEILSALQANEICFVLNARQMGKSSLRVQASNKLRSEKTLCASVDLSVFSKDICSEAWCKGFCKDLLRVLSLSRKINLDAWWQQYKSFTLLQQLKYFFEDIILEYSNSRIVIFIDEVESLIHHEFKDDFFRVIRLLYNARADSHKFERINFCLLGVASPSELIKDTLNTPFNIGYSIELRGFTVAEAQPLLFGLSDIFDNPEIILNEIQEWTGGQPFLMQKICDLIAKNSDNRYLNIEDFLYKKIIDNWEYNDNPIHLRTIRDRLLHDPQKVPRLLDLYSQILKSGTIRANGSPEETDLKLSGLIVQKDGVLHVCNRIYERIFDQNWIQERLDEIRPYSDSIKRWIASGCSDSSRLLRGQELLEAKNWSDGRQLSNLDYRFLAESQDYDRHLDYLRQQAGKVKLQRKLLGAIFIGFIISLSLGLLAYIQYKKSDLREFHSTMLASEALFQAGNKLDATVQAIKAYRKWKISGFDESLGSITSESILRQAIYSLVEKNRFVGHQRAVRDIAYSSNGKFIASASADTTVKLWKPNGTLIRTLEGRNRFQHRVFSLAISPDNQKILSADRRGYINIWSYDGSLLKTYQAHNSAIRSISFSTDGLKIASASDDSTIRVWDSDGTLLALLKDHRDRVNDTVFSPNGQMIASASWDRTIKLWSLDGTVIRTIQGYNSKFLSLDFSPNGQILASASADGMIRLWTLDGNLIKSFQGHDEKINMIRFRTDGKLIVTVSDDKSIKIWKLDGTLISKFYSSDEVNAIDFDPSKQLLISATDDGTVRIWKPQHPMKKILKGHDGVVRGVSISSNGKIIASSSWDKSIKLWRYDGTLIRTLKGHRDGIRSIAFSPDNEWLVSASDDKSVKIWRIDGTLFKTLDKHNGRVRAIAFSPDGKWFVSASDDKTIKIWNPIGNLIKEWKGHGDLIRGIDIHPNGKIIVSASWDGTIKLWRTNGTLIRLLKGHNKPIKGIKFSPDGQTIASASWDQTIRIWDIDGTLLNTFIGHKNVVKGVAFSPDGKVIASASDDQTVKLWNIDGSLIASLPGHGDQVWDVTFSPTKNRLLSVGGDQAVIIWDLDKVVDLRQLVIDGCNWIEDYLSTNTKLSESDRLVCEGID